MRMWIVRMLIVEARYIGRRRDAGGGKSQLALHRKRHEQPQRVRAMVESAECGQAFIDEFACEIA